MPIATTNQDGERKELKSLPGAYVVVKRLTYGQKLRRLEESSKMIVTMGKGQKDTKGELDMLQFAASFFDFSRCIIDHNLEKEEGGQVVKMNFTNQADFLILDPRVGDEVSKILDKLNNFEEDPETGNSTA